MLRTPSALEELTCSIPAGGRGGAKDEPPERQFVSKPKFDFPPKMRRAELEDYDQIVALQNRNGLISRQHENWLDFWLNNPVYKRLGGSWPIGWVFENTNSTIVGWQGNLPSAYYFGGKELICATSSPWVVDKPYRGYSTLLLGQLTWQKGADLVVLSTAGATVGPLSDLFGYSKPPVGIWDTSAFWITNYPDLLRITLSTRGVPLARQLGYPLAAALFVRDYFKAVHKQKEVTSPFAEIEECWQFDSRFDEFWQRLKQDRNDTLLAVRTLDTLNWHFRDQLTARQLWILTACNESRIVSVAMLDRRDRASGLTSLRLVDFQALRGWEKMLIPFLSHALEKCRRERIHCLEVIGCWLDRPGLPRVVAPHRRRLPSWLFYYKPLNQEFASALQQPTAWAPSSFDGDASV